MDAVSLLTWRVPRFDAAAVEAATLADGSLDEALHAVRDELGVQHLYYLATCQRVLWVLQDAPDDAPAALRAAYRRLGRQVPEPERHRRFAAFGHLCEVASSLDALVPGEPQVLGQVKAALQRCDEAGLLGGDLRHVFDHVLRTAKEVRSGTLLFQGKVSLLPLAEDAMREALDAAGPGEPEVAVLGTGQIGQQAIERVRALRPRALIHVVSRNRLRAHEFAAEHDATGHTLERFLDAPPAGLGLVVAAMRTEAPLLTGTWLARHAAKAPLTVLDLALPRNTERPDDAPRLRLLQMDELTRLSQQARQVRAAATDDARRILDDAVDRVRHEYDLRCHASTLHRLTRRFEEVAETRWAQAHGVDPEDPRTRKWFDQTVRALLHEATAAVKAPAQAEDTH